VNSADQMRRLFDIAAVQTNAAPDDAVFEKVKTAYTKTIQHKSAQREPGMWRFVMKSPLTKLAVAAAVIIACVIGLSLWKTTGSGMALADVLARVEQVKAVKYQWTYTFSGYTGPNKPYNQEIRATSLDSGEYGTKSNWEWLDPNGGESGFSTHYFLPQKKTTIAISSTQKTYMRRLHSDAQVAQMQKESPDIKDPLAFVRKILKTKCESLGRSTMDGIEVTGWRTTDPNLWGGQNPQVDFKLWVDVNTLLPVRYEVLASVEVDEMGDRLNNHLVEYGFQWDVSVDPAEFEPPPVPEGYAVLDNSPGQVNEETAIEGLKKCVELFGRYLESSGNAGIQDVPSALEKSETPTALRLKEEFEGLTKQEKEARLIRAGIPIFSLVGFYNRLVEDKKDPAYYGKTVTPKDGDKVLMRWKVSDNEYRVIFGDLHAETVSPARLAELEKGLPK
jgi:hypothetical protein